MSSQAELENYNLNLRRDLGRTINDRDEWRILAKRRGQALDRVRALHVPHPMDAGCCTLCSDYYPCPTIRALDG